MKKMCTKTHARKLVARLRILPLFGDDAQGSALRAEVGKALMEAAASDDHATVIVDALVKRLHKFPIPADVYEESAGTRENEVQEFDSVKKYGGSPEIVECWRCKDLGWHGDGKKFVQCKCKFGVGLEEFIRQLNKPLAPKFRFSRMMTSAEFAQKAGL